MRAGCTPGTPPSSRPRPPNGFSRKYAPATAAEAFALLASVYSEQDLFRDQVVEVLRPDGGEPRVEDWGKDTDSISGKGTYFYAVYWLPRLFVAREQPTARDMLGFRIRSAEDMLLP